jgi:hypothetical protein
MLVPYPVVDDPDPAVELPVVVAGVLADVLLGLWANANPVPPKRRKELKAYALRLGEIFIG